MRRLRRLYTGTKRARSCIMLGLLLTLSACSLPNISIDKKQKVAAASAGFFSSVDSHNAQQDPYKGDSKYFATVHVRFSDTSSEAYSFDVRREKRDLVSVNMMQTEETSTYLHMGFTHTEGGIAGLRFVWRFSE